MGFKLFEDKIGTLTKSGSTITISASRVMVGGQQYAFTSLSTTLGTLAANQLYMLYVTVSGTTPSLSYSTSVNSVGPGTTQWKLVGAFVTTYASVFGTFLAIDTTRPTLNSKPLKSSSFTFPTTGQYILNAWISNTDPFFDDVNGYYRFPIAGNWRITCAVDISAAGGTADTLKSNIFAEVASKATAPSSPADGDDNFGADNGPWFASTDSYRRFHAVGTKVAGAYAWVFVQSNLISGTSISNARMDVTLDSIPVAIRDM